MACKLQILSEDYNIGDVVFAKNLKPIKGDTIENKAHMFVIVDKNGDDYVGVEISSQGDPNIERWNQEHPGKRNKYNPDKYENNYGFDDGEIEGFNKPINHGIVKTDVQLNFDENRPNTFLVGKVVDEFTKEDLVDFYKSVNSVDTIYEQLNYLKEIMKLKKLNENNLITLTEFKNKYLVKESFEYHDELNPKLWNNNILKPDVKIKLLEIYNQFKQQLEEKEIPIDVVDVLLLGSNAGYNYMDNSDIDLHIVVDFDDMCLDKTLTQLFYNHEKTEFNDNYDITIKGLPVEVYIEDVNAGNKSDGIYSLLQDKWLQYPKYEPPGDIDYSDLLNQYKTKISEALNSNSPEQIKSLINEIKMLRKLSLNNSGIYSKGNLVFKELRNDGSIDSLYEKYRELISQELTLEKVEESIQDGIKKYNIKVDNKNKSIGFSEDEQKWYGWSHRAMYGFKIGDKCKDGDSGVGYNYTFKDGDILKTLDDCKQRAIDFANSVT